MRSGHATGMGQMKFIIISYLMLSSLIMRTWVHDNDLVYQSYTSYHFSRNFQQRCIGSAGI